MVYACFYDLKKKNLSNRLVRPVFLCLLNVVVGHLRDKGLGDSMIKEGL